MAPNLEISIPTTSTNNRPKPHTLYHITLRLPLRTFTITKRYSEFTSLQSALASQAGQTPPAPLPPKNLFSTTLGNATLTEQRRVGLERFLREINGHADDKWRDTSAWRHFLNLPSNIGGRSEAADSLHATLTSAANSPVAAVKDPVAWLDTHRELKQYIQSARSTLAERDAGRTDASAAETHDASAQAKKELVRATQLLGTLEKGLKENGAEWGAKKLGDGEVRRRRDLLTTARRDIEGLESLVALVRKKGEVDGVVEGMSTANGSAGQATRDALVGGGGGGARAGVGKGRVLGKETTRTRELDNKGVLQLQQQMMEEQDESVDILGQAVRRQRELAEQINEELEFHDGMLNALDEDVDRLGGKVKVARKRVDKIS